MTILRRFIPVLLAFVLCQMTLTGCVNKGFPATPAPAPVPAPVPVPEFLAGNWLLTGTVGSEGQTSPISTVLELSSSLIVSGNQVGGTGFIQVPCSPGGFISSTILFNGTVSSSGLLQASSNTSVTPYTNVTLTAIAPTAANPSVWSGTINLTPGQFCPFTQTLQFTAQPIAPVNGNYVGSLTQANPNTALLGTSMSMQLTQGAPVFGPALGGNNYYIPLTGTISITGSPCFTTGTTNNGPDSVIQGDAPLLSFTMNDGSQLLVENGNLGDLAADSIHNLSLLIQSGPCTSAARANLIRQ